MGLPHTAAMDRLRAEAIDWRFKGFPNLAGATIADVPRLGLDLLTGGFTLPLMVLREDDLGHNLSWMSHLVSGAGARLAPHAKTTMSPQIVSRQLRHGAWAVTVATVSQARVFIAFGATRLIVANEIVSEPDIAWVAETTLSRPDVELHLLVDSVESVRLLHEGLAARGDGLRPVPVLIELGAPGARAGAREPGIVLEIADAVHASPFLCLTGIEGFEGAVPGESRADREQGIRTMLGDSKAAVRALSARGLLPDVVIVSFGGSSYFDLVLNELGGQWLPGHDLSLVLRSGCYVTHDHGLYASTAPPFASDPEHGLRPAIEVWGSVLSRPERGLAIVGFGRRDVPHDAGLPVPLRFSRDGEERAAGTSEIFALNDQHAYVRLDPALSAAPGDVLIAGISHPCTAFDKWPLIPVVDKHYRVVEAVRTYF